MRMSVDSSEGITFFVIALHHQRPQLINICMFCQGLWLDHVMLLDKAVAMAI